jgi:hypothetical protein
MGGRLGRCRHAIESHEGDVGRLRGADGGADRRGVLGAGDDEVDSLVDQILDVGRLPGRIGIGNVDHPLEVDAAQFDWPLATVTVLDWHLVLLLVYLGVGPTALAYICYCAGMARCRSAVVGLIASMIEPALAAVLAVLVLALAMAILWWSEQRETQRFALAPVISPSVSHSHDAGVACFVDSSFPACTAGRPAFD